MDAESFRDFVLSVLGEAFPDEPFLPGERADAIRWKDSEIGLHNLHADAALMHTEPAMVRQTIVEHFSRIVKLTDTELASLPATWDEARTRVRLQLMPANFARVGVSVTFPFLDEVLISIVVDAEHGYAYVRTEDVERWQVGLIDLYEAACENLTAASQNLGVSYYPGPPAIVALDTTDGYAAARLLLPSLRQFITERLGSPFCAGIPNRDFLIMWSATEDAQFQERMQVQLNEDTKSRSHPLSSRILNVTVDSIS
ncbi:MAG: hypothetical protein IT423_14425 [Pirellulaceae bacterium]|nr:hypothetical protein [Pirellulaceae bacterium]